VVLKNPADAQSPVSADGDTLIVDDSDRNRFCINHLAVRVRFA
jgi:hypothetical protein